VRTCPALHIPVFLLEPGEFFVDKHEAAVRGAIARANELDLRRDDTLNCDKVVQILVILFGSARRGTWEKSDQIGQTWGTDVAKVRKIRKVRTQQHRIWPVAPCNPPFSPLPGAQLGGIRGGAPRL
jgi:hypothetical protein